MKFYRYIILSVLLSIHSFANLKIDQNFIDEIVYEYNFDRSYLNELFSKANIQKRALKIYALKPKNTKKSKTAKKDLYWSKYKKIFITPKKIRKGALFLKKHKKALKRAYEEYGVDPSYIAAIIGIESYYGKNTGKYRVLDTLCTLAFMPNRRNDFFKKELKEFLVFTQKTNFDPLKIKGSYAGAIGLGQFMPSSYNNFAVDFDKDGIPNPWNSEDMIGSIAKYLKDNGWEKNGLVAVKTKYKTRRFTKLKTGYKTKYSIKKLKRYKIISKNITKSQKKVSLIKLENKNFDELWIGFKNFYVITRYNHSSYYAMAVHILAQKIKKLGLK